MKVSRQIVNHYAKGIEKFTDQEIVDKIGKQLGAVEAVEDWRKSYDKIVTVKVVSCEKHPNADSLNVCRIDDGGVTSDVERGDDGLIQVVCGAPNVKQGVMVAWIPPGATVPSSLHTADPFILGVRELRGIKSNGMLASPSELDLFEDHSGLLIINDQSLAPGQAFAEVYGVGDFIIDCENKMFTHRPDCFGNLGVAREIAGICGIEFTSPDWYQSPLVLEQTSSLSLRVTNDIYERVPRFMVQVVEGVANGESDPARKIHLHRSGIRPINRIVDLTNYYMQLTAQPTHAFDYDKIKALSDGDDPYLFPRMAKEGEKLTLLNGKTIELSSDDIVIATNKQAVALAGVMGGSETEVDETTKNIIIECATFDMYSIRKTAMRHGIFTDAVTRFNKGQSSLQNDKVLAKIVAELIEQGGNAGQVYDCKTTLPAQKDVIVSVSFINERLGSSLDASSIAKLLSNVEINVQISGDELTICPPFWRTDLHLPEDIVEEVGRLFGYDNLPVELPVRPIRPQPINKKHEQRMFLREKLASLGANEVLSYSFVHGDLLRKTGTEPEKWAYHIRNAISPDLQYYRTSLLPGLLDKVHKNLKSDLVRTDLNAFALFEIGKVHVKEHLDDQSLPEEFDRLALVVAADDKSAAKHYDGAPYYHAKKYLTQLTNGKACFEPLTDNSYPITAPYQIDRSAVVSINGEVLACVGEFRKTVKTSLKLPSYCAGFEVDLNLLLKHVDNHSSYTKTPTFPKSMQDLTLEVADSVLYQDVHDIVWDKMQQLANEKGYFATIQNRDIFANSDNKKRITFRIWLSHYHKTLTTAEVNEVITEVVRAANKQLGATQI